ncbi:isoleucine--tRNA ligase [Pseudoclavibacter sp. CFCC 13796]|uniref:isoleucine--tRNA ligase n=1 Tax=Pseudoclavibacter sp. CFCC 13796 TaxID=2615179 RepID=UPI00130195E0|nr:isoleucine--tRNA ligase [Pseudoclavibacter sp. CFCC 13796]KAB1662091.1 isoleucine--tRNA ligase [Pseudoclavibacter sp. CFCC 13796]
MVYPLPSPGSEHPESVQPSPSFPAVEQGILAFWKGDDTFQKSIDQRRDQHAPEWVFYDGPPFANGLPHYGHLLTGYAKDVFPRFHTMRGQRVERRFGWDTHGLPAELQAEKELGITDKREIEETFGIAKFNEATRASVLRFTNEWREYVTRSARWVDFDNDYKTLDLTYMESVIWAFKTLYDKGLIYDGYRVLPYSWYEQTPLSNQETKLDDAYRMRQDPTVTVTFPLTGDKAAALGLEGAKAIAWTTTPWTLPTNLALAVGPEIVYAVVPAGEAGAGDGSPAGTRFVLARDLVGSHAKALGYDSAEAAQDAVERTLLGAELEHVRYERLFDYFADAEQYGTQNAWQILVADYVSTTDGTGIVHQAPAYGEDDQLTCQKYDIPVVLSVNQAGEFLPSVPEVAGVNVFEANKTLIKLVKSHGRLLEQATIEHSYPHSWRSGKPLIYMALPAWFVNVTKVKDRMIALNQQINWVPDNVKDGQFGKWLENARDWNISRNRYWGAPIPVWKSDDPEYPRVDVYGSIEQLEEDFGVKVDNLHRPYIDELTRPNPDDPTGKSTMRRVPEVLDCWFESGSMPFAQVHYPFENKEWFDTHNPSDFIVEYIGQTRGWFYNMHVLATALFDRPAFTNVISHGIVLGNDGQKMSKSLRNYPDVNEVFDRDGSDAMRWFLMSSPVLRGGNLIVTEEGIREGVRQVILPLWSTWYFFQMYANTARPAGSSASGYEAKWRTDSTDVLDQYLLAKTGDLVRTVEVALEGLNGVDATDALRQFADVLTNWYVRRSRDRFWVGEDTDAFDTLYTVLETVTRVAAPLLPLVTERIWKDLTGGESVHLQDWPDAGAFPKDDDLVAAMDQVRDVSSAALALRKAEHLRVRLPLSKLTVVEAGADALAPFADILRDELNVKSVDLVELSEQTAERFGVSKRLTVHARVCGPRLGREVQTAIKGSKTGDWSAEGDQVVSGGIALQPGEYSIDLVADASSDRGTDHAVGLLSGGGFVLLETAVTPELAAEGLARDTVRQVQQARRAAGLEISDRIHLTLGGDEAVRAALEANRDLIAAETLATDLHVVTVEALGDEADQPVGDGERVGILIEKA